MKMINITAGVIVASIISVVILLITLVSYVNKCESLERKNLELLKQIEYDGGIILMSADLIKYQVTDEEEIENYKKELRKYRKSIKKISEWN